MADRTSLSPVERTPTEVLPAQSERERARDLLPAIEPDRPLDDWGRSERVEGVFDRDLVEFFYRYWFRAEVEGIENVPAEGGALLVSNHSGALPPDAAMIAKAIREEHPSPRPLYLTVEHFFKGYPGFSMLIPKIGGVAAHPANVHRLLVRRAAARARLPRGPQGHREALQGPLPAAALRPRRLRRGGDARRGQARPALRRRRRGGGADLRPGPALQRLTGLLYFPLTPTLSVARAARDARLPAGEVQDPLPGADRHRSSSAAPTPSTTRRSCRPSRRRSAPGSRRTSTTWSRSGSPCGSDRGDGAPSTGHRALDATGAAAWRRRSRASSRSRRSSASTRASRRSSSSGPSS